MRRAVLVWRPLSIYCPKTFCGSVASSKVGEGKTKNPNTLCEGGFQGYVRLYSSTKRTDIDACWKCHYKWGSSDTVTLICPNCNSLRKIKPEKFPNYFELLNHEKTYQVDLTRLAKQTKFLQKKLHPDLFSQHGEEEKKISEEMSSLVNKAYSTLQDPIQRGGYLLQLHGIDFANDMEKQLTMDPEFLEEVMELNERLEEISSPKEWLKFRNDNDAKLKSLQSDLGVAFNEQKLDKAKAVISKMKYFDSLQLKLKELQSKIGFVE